MTDDIRIIDARMDDAAAVAEFLHRQDVRPEPLVDDIELLCGQSDAALFCVLRHGRIEGVAGCMQDGPVLHVAYFAVAAEENRDVAAMLVQALEAHGRQVGAALLAAQAERGSPTHRCLARLGFAADWEERDRACDRVVTIVDLAKPL